MAEIAAPSFRICTGFAANLYEYAEISLFISSREGRKRVRKGETWLSRIYMARNPDRCALRSAWMPLAFRMVAERSLARREADFLSVDFPFGCLYFDTELSAKQM